MSQHTIVAMIHDRPGAIRRTVSHLDRRGFAFGTLAIGRCQTTGAGRMTLAVEATHAARIMQHLGELEDVIGVSDASLWMRMEEVRARDGLTDFRDQADGVPHHEAA